MSWFSRRPKVLLYPWDIAYFEHLIAELNALDLPPTDPRVMRARALIDEFNQNRAMVQRSSLLELEQTLLSLQPNETLLQRAPVIRLRYRDVVGERQYAVYTPSEIPPAPCSDEALRKALLPDLRNLVSGIHWRYILLPLLDRVQRGLTIQVLKWILFYTAIWIVALLILGQAYQIPFLSMLATVVFAGIVGGYISALRRVQSVRSDTDSLLTIQALENGGYFLWLSPLLGAIFAVVLLLVFIAGLVGGTVFPAFQEIQAASSASTYSSKLSGWYFLTHLYPIKSTDYAKLFLWSFVAGFAERFVPDILDRVIQRGENGVAEATGGTSTAPKTPKPTPPPAPNGKPTNDGTQLAQNLEPAADAVPAAEPALARQEPVETAAQPHSTPLQPAASAHRIEPAPASDPAEAPANAAAQPEETGSSGDHPGASGLPASDHDGPAK
jgi:hypothetical protein